MASLPLILLLGIVSFGCCSNVDPGCPPEFKEEEGYSRLVHRATCYIEQCDPKSGNKQGVGCSVMQLEPPSRTESAKLNKEQCYEDMLGDKSKVYPKCCPKPTKVCKGDDRFDESKVPEMPKCFKRCGTRPNGRVKFCMVDCL